MKNKANQFWNRYFFFKSLWFYFMCSLFLKKKAIVLHLKEKKSKQPNYNDNNNDNACNNKPKQIGR
jgi:hypothetical protein